MSLLVRVQDDIADRTYKPVELLRHDVAQKGGSCSGLCLDLSAVRKVEGCHLYPGIGVPGAVDGVIGVDVGLSSRDKCLVLVSAWKFFLKVREHCLELVQHLCALDVLEKHVGLVRSLEAIKLVVIDLVRANDQIHLAVSHLKPCEIAVIVVI